MQERVSSPRRRFRVGPIWVDDLNFAAALDEVERLVGRGHGGTVFTPNVDHVVKAAMNPSFKRAYDRVSLSLADGMPLVWAGSALGCPLQERVAGLDLVRPLLERAGRRGWRVYLLGGAPGVAQTLANRLEKEGVVMAGWDDCRIDSDGSDPGSASIERARQARPDIIFVGLGPPKQELWIDRAADALSPAVILGVGASLDFLVGKHRRAPRWIGRIGLEWAYRLVQEPRRLWRRYLLEGPRFVGIFLSTLFAPEETRVRHVGSAGPGNRRLS